MWDDTPLLALLLLIRPFIADVSFAVMVPAAFLILAFLHVTTTIKVPAVRGKTIPIVSIIAIVASMALASGGA